MASKNRYNQSFAFEEALASDDDLDVVELPVSSGVFWVLGACIVLFSGVVVYSMLSLGISRFSFYRTRAQANASAFTRVEAPRGFIVDRAGDILADNAAAFSLFLDSGAFFKNDQQQSATLQTIFDVVGREPTEVVSQLAARQKDQISDPLLIAEDLSDSQVVKLHALTAQFPALLIQKRYRRSYPQGSVFSSVVGYTSFATADDLRDNSRIAATDTVGRSGIEAQYDEVLRGVPGVTVTLQDAKGSPLAQHTKTDPRIGQTVKLTIDGQLQTVLHDALLKRLHAIGRTNGVGMAINPRTGEILALVNFPTFDNNAFSTAHGSAARVQFLQDSNRPLFNRAVSGVYNPGSTIKPLVGIAALAEHIVPATREFFSPGYLEIPNPYHPENPTRFLDWRFQGNVNLYSAIAQSSNVYFYIVGGGGRGVTGLGITRLRRWWQKFGLGVVTGIDLPGERAGFLPDPEWKEKTRGTPWLLGDTYNVSIGQGDLLLTPLQLLVYTASLANGGTLYRPFVNAAEPVKVNADLTSLKEYFTHAQLGMRTTVTSPKGTAHLLNDLAMPVGAKTGSAQILNNTQENAFFIGYAPFDNPTIALMILVENSKEGSLNAVPVAKEVFEWYQKNRL